MMIYDPDAIERFQWRYERACRDFKEGGSQDIFRASLFALGYCGARLEDEVRYQLFALGYCGARLEDEVRYQLCLMEGMKEAATAGFVNGLSARSW